MDVFDLSAKITLDTKEYESGLSSAENDGKSFASKLGGGLKTAGKVGAAAIGAVSAAATVMGKKLVTGINETAEYGDNVDKMSQKIGISAEAYQKWDYVMQRAGMSIDSMKMGMKTLSKQAEDGSEAFQKLGISQEELKTLSQEDLFKKTVEGLSEMEAGTERTKLATELLGRAGADMGPLLNEGTKEIEKQMNMAEDYGMVMSDSAVKASATFEDSLTTMKSSMTGMKNKMMSEFLPSITKVTDGLAKMFSGDMSGVNKLSKGISGMISKVANAMPKILEAGSKILTALADAILENAPRLVPTAVKLVVDLAQYIINALPQLLTVGVQIITELITAISEAIPQLTESAANIVITLADAIINNLPQIITAGLNLILGLAQGIIKAIPQIVAALPKIITALVNGILSSIPQIIDAGVKLLTSLVDNLDEIISSIIEAVPEIILGLVDAFANNVDKIIEAGVNLLTSLVTNLPEIILKIVEAVPKIIVELVSALIGSIPKLIGAGLKLAGGIIKGILNFVVQIPEKLVEFVKGIIDYFASGQVIEDLKAAGEAIIDAIWEGMKAIWDTVVGWVKSIIDWIKNAWMEVKNWFKKIFGKEEINQMVRGVTSTFEQMGVITVDENGNIVKKGMNVETDPRFKKRTARPSTSLSVTSNTESQNVNNAMLDKLDSLENTIKQASKAGSTIVLDNRELGRAVRRYA